jgi:hypothetical protein
VEELLVEQLRCPRVISTEHTFVQNLRRGHGELEIEEPTTPPVVAALTDLIRAT